ncbi:MAG: outer membrane protein CzcC [marine bacterium B5-7]|nr:MAG: outer membrane protein CzcC [marine bacterium B5-7]
MAIKKLVFIFACLIHATAMAAENDLVLPPIVSPETFDNPIIQPSGTLSLKKAITLTLEHNPELAAYAWGIRSREIDRIQAGLLPNPELGIEVENFAGSGDVSSFRSAEMTIALSQLIELGDKRVKRQQIALTEHSLARWDYEIKRIDLLTATARIFIAVLSQQEMQSISNETYSLASEVYESIKKRVAAGKATTLEELKARVEVSKARLKSINSKRQLTLNKHSLATLWGNTETTFTDVVGDIYTVSAPPDLNSIINKINNNPNLARWVTAISREQSSVALAQANMTPDLTVSTGLRYLNGDNDVAAVASISVPLYLFDDKKTGVRRSEIELNRALKEKATTELKIRSTLIQDYQQLVILYDEVLVLRDEVLPVSEEAFISAKKMYQLGKLGLLALLDTQRTYFEVRQQYIEILTAYQLMVANIERLIGGGLSSFR